VDIGQQHFTKTCSLKEKPEDKAGHSTWRSSFVWEDGRSVRPR